MSQQNLGPKTGTYEPPSYNELTHTSSDLWYTVKDMHERMSKSDKKISELLQLMQEIIGAYDRNDKESLSFLLCELEKIKKEHYVKCQG
jgi:hypothetical protein